jgi:hypothetical protein
VDRTIRSLPQKKSKCKPVYFVKLCHRVQSACLGMSPIGESHRIVCLTISGLTYTPGMYAATSELAVLCQVLGQEFPGAYYAPHHRGYGVNALGNYDEMLQLGRATKCPVRK